MAQEHQEYIQAKVNPTLEKLVTQVLLERPENPVPFMVKWLAKQTKQGARHAVREPWLAEAERLRSEVAAMREEVRRLEAKLGDAATASCRASEYEPIVVPKSQEQKDRLMEVLQQSFMFSTLERADQCIIVDALAEKRAEANERIIQEGEDGSCMFVIEQGSVDCIKGEQVLKRCLAGDLFGELALLYDCPRAATAVSQESCVLWQLDRATFNHIVRDASIRKREAYDEFLAQVPLLEPLGKYKRSQIADALRQQTVPAGTVVINQGEEGHRFCLVEDGELVVQSAEPGNPESKEVLTYKRGDHFGELAQLGEDIQASTVVARTDAKLLWVDRGVFGRVSAS